MNVGCLEPSWHRVEVVRITAVQGQPFADLKVNPNSRLNAVGAAERRSAVPPQLITIEHCNVASLTNLVGQAGDDCI